MIPSISSVSPQAGAYPQPPLTATKTAAAEDASSKPANPGAAGSKDTLRLSETDLKIVQQLKQRDTEVRAHELAHLAAAGGIATSGASFEYQQGPDGVRYAVGGEVNIDTSGVDGNPVATLRKSDIIKSAALAPAEPSSQDLQVAASATAMAAKAAADLLALMQPTNQNPLGTQLNLFA